MKNLLLGYFSDLVGVPCWGVKQGYGSFLTFEFGTPSQSISDVRESRSPSFPASKYRTVVIGGDWHLWIYCCGWRIIQEDKILANDESETDSIGVACRVLDGQALETIEVDPDKMATRFIFDLGGELVTYPYDEELNEQWLLYCPDEKVFTFRSDGRYSFNESDVHPDKEEWKKLSAVVGPNLDGAT